MDVQNRFEEAGVQVRFIRMPTAAFILAFLCSPGHFRYHIIAITEGDVEIVYGQNLYKAQTGHIYVLPVDCFIRPAGAKEARFWMLRFTEYYAATALYSGNSIASFQPASGQLYNLHADTASFKVIKKLFLLLDKHQQYSQSANSELICRLTYNLLISCLNELAVMPATLLITSLKRKEYIAVEFLKLAERRAKEHHDVHYYAEILCMTQGNLRKIVKEVTTKPPKILLEEILIRLAKELLDSNLNPIYEVAEELNFKSSSAFINFFRSQTGITPNEYRNRNTR